jgi:hypothetical protein
MLRFTDLEYESLVASKPQSEELASFARIALLDAIAGRSPDEALRRAASFVVASLSPDITFEEALDLFDQHVTHEREEVADGRVRD